MLFVFMIFYFSRVQTSRLWEKEEKIQNRSEMMKNIFHQEAKDL